MCLLQAVDEHVRSGQPYISLVKTILSQAISDIASGDSTYQTTPAGAAAISQAQHILTELETGLTGNISTQDKRQFANRIGTLVAPAVLAVRSLFEALWNGTKLSAEVARRIRDEVTVLVALEGRDGRALQFDILICSDPAGA
jgi:hypothetical protein